MQETLTERLIENIGNSPKTKTLLAFCNGYCEFYDNSIAKVKAKLVPEAAPVVMQSRSFRMLTGQENFI